MSDTLTCKFNEVGSQIPETLNTALTVGTEFMLHCDGTVPSFDTTSLKAEALNQAEHTIKLLKFEAKQNAADITLTSYRVGEFKDVQLLFTDGKQMIRTNPVTWKVQSVIDPQNPEAAQPFGPFGPWKISWPWWYFLVVVLVVAVVVLACLKAWRAARRKIEVRKKIADYRQKFNPFDQFQKTLRRLDREVQRITTTNTPVQKLIEELSAASLTYLMMEFEADVEGKSPRGVARALKRKSPKARENVLNDLVLYLSEFKRGKAEDIEKMLDWAGRISEKVDRESFGVKP